MRLTKQNVKKKKILTTKTEERQFFSTLLCMKGSSRRDVICCTHSLCHSNLCLTKDFIRDYYLALSGEFNSVAFIHKPKNGACRKKKLTAYHMLTLPINSQRVLAFGRLLSGALGAGYQKKVHTGKFLPYNL